MSTVQSGYGYQDDAAEVSTGGQAGIFGLNQANVRLIKWEYMTHGGAKGALGEALDIVFTIDGAEKGYRVFPISKAFLPNNGGETSDPTHPAMQEAFKAQNAVLTHILHCFVEKNALIRALSVPNMNFKTYCEITKGILPVNFAETRLDMFLEYQWAIRGEATRTYLQIPKKMKSGLWLCVAQRPMAADGVTTGIWEEVRVPNFNTNTPKALTYVDQMGNEHPFHRNGYFLASHFANQQNESASNSNGNYSAMAPTLAPTQAPTQAMPTATIPAPGGAAPAVTGNGGW